jgi:hypothetical protein
MFMDLMMALAIATAVLLSLSVAMGAFRRAERGMADARADYRRLEQGLLTLQTGGTLAPDLRSERLGDGPANHVWVRLSLRPSAPVAAPQSGPEAGNSAQRPAAPQPTAALVGLVPADKAAGGVP